MFQPEMCQAYNKAAIKKGKLESNQNLGDIVKLWDHRIYLENSGK